MSIDSRYSIGDNRRGYGEGGERVRRRWEERERERERGEERERVRRGGEGGREEGWGERES